MDTVFRPLRTPGRAKRFLRLDECPARATPGEGEEALMLAALRVEV
jgi:hypothetical protein